MKLERERDIPAFKGKSWREKVVLRKKALELDPWIFPLQFFGIILIMFVLAVLSHLLGDRFFPNLSFLAFAVIFSVLSLPAAMLFSASVITPRIRKALELHEKLTR